MKHSFLTLGGMEHHPTAAVAIDILSGESPDTTILKVSGPLTIHNFFEFQDLSRQQTTPVLLIDLSDVPYIDSAALGSLIGVHVSRGASQKRYALVGANGRLQSLFSMTNTSQFLVAFPTLAEAQAALA